MPGIRRRAEVHHSHFGSAVIERIVKNLRLTAPCCRRLKPKLEAALPFRPADVSVEITSDPATPLNVGER
jgi:hypothetical protein